MSINWVKSQTPFSQKFDTENGLSDNEVYHVIEDSKGYIWVATNNGVNRFDGNKFTVFTIEDGLTDNTIFEIYEDYIGRIWFVSQSCQLSYFYNNKILKYKYNDKLLAQYKGSVIPQKLGFRVDSNNNIFINIVAQGEYCVTPQGKISNEFFNAYQNYIVIRKDKLYYNINTVLSRKISDLERIRISVDNNGVINNFKIKKFNPDYSYRICCKQKNVLYYIMDNYLFRIINSDMFVKDFSTSTLWVSVDCNNTLWVGTSNKGVFGFENCNIKNKPSFHYFKNKSVSSVFRDKNKGLWFSTLESGLYYMPNSEINIFNTSDGLMEDYINCVTLIEGTTWFAYQHNYISTLSNQNCIKHKKIVDDKDSQIFEILFKPKHKETIISCNRKLVSIKNNKFNFFYENLLFRKGRKYVLSGGYDICIDNKGRLWVAWANGLGLVERNENVFQTDFINKNMKIKCLEKHENVNKLWLGTPIGLVLFTFNSKNYKKCLFQNFGDKFPILKNSITKLRFDSISHTLIIGTKNQGVVLMKNNKCYQLTTKNGLSDNFITSLQLNNGYLWVGTINGLNKVKIVDLEFSKYYILKLFKSNGLPSNRINDLIVNDKEIIIATDKGLVKCKNNNSLFNTSNTPIYISSININGKKTDIVNEYDLEYNQNNISINFIGISLRSAKHITYAYRFGNDDSRWVETKNPELSFVTLPPGDYKFELLAINENGIKSNKPVVIKIKINPPYWATWWFKLSVFLMACALLSLVLLIIYRIKTKELVEKKILTQKLNKYMQQAFNKQLNPHFIFNTLGSIQNFILKNDSTLSNKYLTKFATLIRRTLDNSRNELISLCDDIQSLELYLEFEKLRFNDKMNYEIIVDEEIEAEYCMIPPFLIQPFVENAIWHGIMHKDLGGKVIISYKLMQDDISIEITDDGVGRKKSFEINSKLMKKHVSHGIDITEQRLNALNSLYDKKMILEYIDLISNNGVPLGTKVKLTIPIIYKESLKV